MTSIDRLARLSRPVQVSADPWISLSNEKSPNEKSPKAALAYPSQPSDAFSLTPLLTLPTSFGNAYVTERFSCTLCVNNELASGDDSSVAREVKVDARLQTPSRGANEMVPLQVKQNGTQLAEQLIHAGNSLQGIIEHELVEAGNYVLAITVTYSDATTPQVRTLRKTYQFVAQPALTIKTKINTLRSAQKNARYTLEARVENLSDQTVIVDATALRLSHGLRAVPFNALPESSFTLAPRALQQIAFLVVEDKVMQGSSDTTMTAQVIVDWRMEASRGGRYTTDWRSP